ncbi:hypothetical protein EVAR_51997_1 [Eumeta japonica]|uniref:Uncharacterized protein n=1 Tax=Eumeta variegata TaxID=151549 RepID=A0A4C1Y259_EUMVA|nr:hypothetical protein EVAR_51997_1 [Eumeta japonica]
MHWKIAKIYKIVVYLSMAYGPNVGTLIKSNRTRLREYEREILKDKLQAGRNRPRLKTQKIFEGKIIAKIIKFLAKGCTNTGWLYTPVTPNPY